jgi:undecaprenyl-diphosphatase
MGAKPTDNTHRRGSDLLEPVPDGWSVRLGANLGNTHPVFGLLSAAVLSYVVLSILLIGSGLVVTHVLVKSPLGRWDVHVDRWLAAHRTPSWNSVSADLTAIGNTLTVVVVAFAITIFLALRRRVRPALFLVAALAVELSVFLSVNHAVGRRRPLVHRLGYTATTLSWPSGHVAATATLYGGIALLVMITTRRTVPRTVGWLVAVVVPSGVAVSRVYRGEHYPTDVIAGALLGIGALASAVLVVRVWPVERPR